jgi:hypothetical protein
MAHAVRVVGIPKTWDRADAPVWSYEGAFWSTPRLMKDPRLRPVEDDGCIDYLGVFTVEEALAINGEYLSSGKPEQRDHERRLQALLEEHKNTHFHVLVDVFEWESGLND